jgi:hypothetical protein
MAFTAHGYHHHRFRRPARERGRAVDVGVVQLLVLTLRAWGHNYPIVTFQYSSTTLYQVSYHIQYLFF